MVLFYFPSWFFHRSAPLFIFIPQPSLAVYLQNSSLEAEPSCTGGKACHEPEATPEPPPFSQHPSQLITFPVNSGIHFVYFHNVVSCPYSIENIFPHFRVQVTQFIAIYSTKADSNSTDGGGGILPTHHRLSVLEIKMVIHRIDYGK